MNTLSHRSILNYFVNRSTNTLAKYLTAKIKAFRSQFRDMLKFIEFQLGNNEIAKESHKVLVDYTEEVGIAYFWEVDASNPDLGKFYSHHGGVPRSQCFLFILPKHDLGIFLITNQSGKDTAPKMKKAIDEIIGGIITRDEQKKMN